MSITLELPEDLESALATEAAYRGLSLSEYALQLLSTRSTLSTAMPTTGEALVAYWQREGVIGTRPDISDSLTHARKIRRRAERRVQR